MVRSVRRFACTRCGACCDRSPEVELSEAAALADQFVFRLMFRIYSLPRLFDSTRSDTPQVFYEKKRLLNAHAARVSRRKVMRNGRPLEQLDYLMISALAVDTAQGSCAALQAGSCSIYQRRPLACRTVPFHYARPEASAEPDLELFVIRPGYRCDIGESAPVVLDGGTIVDPSTRAARSAAISLLKAEGPWRAAIVRSIRTSRDGSLPTFEEVEANAGFATVTTSMRIAWQIALEAGMMAPDECTALVQTQLATIERELKNGRASPEERETLLQMKSEYRRALAR